MKYLLDTCVLSESLRPRPAPGVLEWLAVVDEDRCHLSVITLGEIQKGITRLPDSARRRRLQAWLEQELPVRFGQRVLPVDPDTALTWGGLLGKAQLGGSPVPVVDALLAATAIHHDLTLVTRNTSDFETFPVRVLNPWTV